MEEHPYLSHKRVLETYKFLSGKNLPVPKDIETLIPFENVSLSSYALGYRFGWLEGPEFIDIRMADSLSDHWQQGFWDARGDYWGKYR